MNTPRNLRSLLPSCLCLIAIVIFAATTVMAATIEVNTPADTAADDGQCSLREAITAANTDTASGVQIGECASGDGNDTITFGPLALGSIRLTSVLPDIASNINLLGPGRALLTIQVNDPDDMTPMNPGPAFQYRVFTIDAAAVVSITGVTIAGGFVRGADGSARGEDADGGGIYNAGVLTIDGCQISRNMAMGGRAGGGIVEETSNGVYQVVGGSGRGGGIYNSGILTVKNSRVGENAVMFNGGRSGTTDGGGIYNRGTLTILESSVDSNSTTVSLLAYLDLQSPILLRGNGIFNEGRMELVRTRVINNGDYFHSSNIRGPRQWGGGIATVAGETIVTDCRIANNFVFAFATLTGADEEGASGYGGGIYSSHSRLEIAGTEISGNRARGGVGLGSSDDGNEAMGAGGGLFVRAGSLNLVNSTIDGNLAANHTHLACTEWIAACENSKSQGGGLYLQSTTATVVNVTITNNHAHNTAARRFLAEGAGFYILNSTASLRNTVIAGNELVGLAYPWAGPDVNGVFASQGHNFIGDPTAGSGWINSDILGGDPQLGPLTVGNGGITATRMPSLTSPLINAGDNTSAPLTDQRGVTRLQPWNTTVDIGAVEGAYHPPVARCQNRGLQADQNGQATTVPQLVDAGSTDPDGEPLTFTWDHPGPFSLGDTQVTLTVTDRAGLSSTCTATISVGDFIPPMLILPASFSVDAQTLAGATVNYEASARDVVDGDVPITCTPASGSIFPLGQTTVRCTATDSRGNRNDGGFEVSVEDYVPPVIENAPDDISVPTAGTFGAVVTWPMPTSSDLIAGALPVTCTPPSGSIFPVGNTVVTCSSTDTRGNRTSRSFNVTVAAPPQATLHITADGTFRYDGMSHPVSVSVTGANNEDLSTQGTLTVTYTDASGLTSTLAPKDAGTYAVSVSFVSASNYSSVSDTLRTITITRAPLRIKALTAVKTYGDPTPEFKVDYLGFVFGEGQEVLDGALAFDLTAIPDSPVESYSVMPKGVTARNYDISFLAGIFHVEKARLILTAADASRQYGEANPTFTGTVIGLKNGDNITANYSSVATSSSTVGNYAIVPSLHDPDQRLGNYEVTVNNGSLIIGKAPLTVTAHPTTKVYGAPLPAFDVNYSGFVLGQNESSLSGTLTFSTPANFITGVGTYPVTPGGLSSSNYAITFVDGPLAITRAALTVTANDATKILGEPLTNFSASYAGFVNNDGPGSLTGALTINTDATPLSPVGTYSLIPGGVASPNYDVTFQAGSLSITYRVCLLYDPTKSASGGTFPLKIQLCDINGRNLSSAGVIVHADGMQMVSNNAPQTLMVTGNANPDFNFRFDSTLALGGGYIFNLSTKGLPAGTFIMMFSIAGDPIAHTVQFSVK